MSIQYSGGTLINRTFTPATRADWCNAVTQALSDAGWTTISGTPGSGADVTLETVAQNAGAKIRFRFVDPGANNCAKVTMKHPLGSTAESQVVFCLPTAGSGTWRVVANKFQFFAFATGGANATAARGWVMGGTIYTPTFINIASGDGLGWMQGGSTGDTDASLRVGFRRGFRRNTNVPPAWSGVYSSNLLELVGSSATGGGSLLAWQGGSTVEDQAFRWEDNTLPVYEALLSWGTGTGLNNESKIKGQLYDACVLNGSWSSEAIISMDGHTWLVITDTPTASSSATSVLLVAIT